MRAALWSPAIRCVCSKGRKVRAGGGGGGTREETVAPWASRPSSLPFSMWLLIDRGRKDQEPISKHCEGRGLVLLGFQADCVLADVSFPPLADLGPSERGAVGSPHLSRNRVKRGGCAFPCPKGEAKAVGVAPSPLPPQHKPISEHLGWPVWVFSTSLSTCALPPRPKSRGHSPVWNWQASRGFCCLPLPSRGAF